VPAFTLDKAAAAAGYRLEAFDSIGSTSDLGGVRGRAGESGPLWLVTDHQTAGRGRRGKPWATLPPGNLAASLVMALDLPPATGATLGFVAGLAAVRALESCCCGAVGGHGDAAPVFSLKWPNDILVDGAKLVGILLETELRPDGSRFVVVGIGVNVAHAPDDLAYAAASLAGLGYTVDAPGLFEALSREWVELFGLWDRGRNFAAIRTMWLQRAAGLGGDIVVRNGGTSLHGTFETLDASGQLVVRLTDGSTKGVAAGDVYFGLAATVRSGAVG
jgi:BirA family biotin operon repressor/biotin-[acetyl-CoA-carboxylase] ligase